jgi:hypothetical protein
MPLQYTPATVRETPIVPVALHGVSQQVWSELQSSFATGQSRGCCYGGMCCLAATLVLGPIGIIAGLCCCAPILNSVHDSHAKEEVTKINNRHYNGRRVFEWQAGHLCVFPENVASFVVSQQPVYTTAAYGAQPGQVPVMYAPQQQGAVPVQAYATPAQYSAYPAAPPGQYGAPPGQYGAPPGQYGAPPGQYGAAPVPHATPAPYAAYPPIAPAAHYEVQSKDSDAPPPSYSPKWHLGVSLDLDCVICVVSVGHIISDSWPKVYY